MPKKLCLVNHVLLSYPVPYPRCSLDVDSLQDIQQDIQHDIRLPVLVHGPGLNRLINNKSSSPETS